MINQSQTDSLWFQPDVYSNNNKFIAGLSQPALPYEATENAKTQKGIIPLTTD